MCIPQLILQVSLVVADYRLEVRAHTYSNPQGVDSDINCCESFSSPPCPENDCDTNFIFCLRNLGATRDSNPTNCPLGSFQTEDDFVENTFTFDSQFIERPNVPNPLVFTGASWPVQFHFLFTAK